MTAITKACFNCGASFTPIRRQIFCSPKCKLAQYSKARIKTPITCDRIAADGFFLGDLRDELAQIKKSKTCRRDLAGRLRAAILNDAVWASGPARIALILCLLDNPSLLDLSVKWRHPHEKRVTGYPKPTGTIIRRGMGFSRQ